MFASLANLMGYQGVGLGNLSQDTSVRMQQGLLLTAQDPWWGGGEFVWARANGAVRAQGLCVLTPVFDSALQAWRYDASEVPNTANLGRALCVAMGSFTDTQYGWFMVTGVVPVNCSANVAANTTFGITAAGQAGANSAGKQILNGRVMAPGTTTVAKANSVAANASNVLQVTNSDGWFVGVYLSGTGIAAGTTVTSIDSSGRTVGLSDNTTAQVNGTVTATYNNATIHYNVAHLNRPFAQGAIT